MSGRKGGQLKSFFATLECELLAVAAATALLSVAAERAGVLPSVALLLAGAAASFAPGVPRVALDPDLVLLLLLPPLLYAAGVNMSWRGFARNLRPILLLAVGGVLATARAVSSATMHLSSRASSSAGIVTITGAYSANPERAGIRGLGPPASPEPSAGCGLRFAFAVVVSGFSSMARWRALSAARPGKLMAAFGVSALMGRSPVRCEGLSRRHDRGGGVHSPNESASATIAQATHKGREFLQAPLTSPIEWSG